MDERSIRFIENHFIEPLGKADLLKPPKQYPTPVYRYTLCEMSIVWHMYGGSDFKGDANKHKKKVNFSDIRNVESVGFSNKNLESVTFTPKQSRLPWQIKGGANRDHNVLMELQLNKVMIKNI